MIRKSFSVIPGTTKVLDVDKGIVEAWVNSTAVVDLQRDVMEAGCWNGVIKAATEGAVAWPAVCWGHDPNVTTGKVLHAEELAPGDPRLPSGLAAIGAGALKITAAYNLETQRGREAFSDVKFGASTEWSVGFLPDTGAVTYDGKGLRHIPLVERWAEVSNVLVGASPGTATASVKASPEDRKAATADRLAKARGIRAEAKVVPVLTGAEAVHVEALTSALAQLDTLIAQELAESSGEYDDIIRLCCVAEDLLRWAQGEQTEYGDAPMPMMAYVAAGMEALTRKETPQTPATDLSSAVWQALVRGALQEATTTVPPADVPDPSGEPVGLPYFARHGWRA